MSYKLGQATNFRPLDPTLAQNHADLNSDLGLARVLKPKVQIWPKAGGAQAWPDQY